AASLIIDGPRYSSASRPLYRVCTGRGSGRRDHPSARSCRPVLLGTMALVGPRDCPRRAPRVGWRLVGGATLARLVPASDRQGLLSLRLGFRGDPRCDPLPVHRCSLSLRRGGASSCRRTLRAVG